MKRNYLRVHGFGYGENGNVVKSVLYFPNNAGYKDTARMLVEAGLCMSLEEQVINANGGNYSPAAILWDAYLDRLCKTGCTAGVVNMKED